MLIAPSSNTNKFQIRQIPKEMKDRLPAHYFSALESRSALKRGDLHKAVLELVISYKHRFDIIFPPLNAPLVFFKFVRDLCLPRKSLALIKFVHA
jgi:RNA polymerase I-specific transcription initiation factor RRN7